MTQEEKQLLLKDLSARLPYDVIVVDHYGFVVLFTWKQMKDFEDGYISKPYLRPMSSMTEEEKEELIKNFWGSHTAKDTFEELSWYLSKHLDINELIPKGLAIEAPEGMYD